MMHLENRDLGIWYELSMGYLNQNVWIKLKNNFDKEEGEFDNTKSTDACWAGHFSVEPGIFVSNRAIMGKRVL